MGRGHKARCVLIAAAITLALPAHTAHAQRAVDKTADIQDLDPTLLDNALRDNARRLIDGGNQSAIDPPAGTYLLDPAAQDLLDALRDKPAPPTDKPTDKPTNKQNQQPAQPPPPSVTESLLRTDPEVREAYRQVLLARYRRETEKYQEVRDEIRWSHLVGRGIFFVAHIVLAIGLFLSVREFFDARRLREKSDKAAQRAAENAADSPAQAAAENEIRISLEGIALKTSLNGLAVLAVAVGFYYLYLKFVYPVTVVGAP